VTTGISAHDRAHTIITAVRPNARPEDLRQPGHIFPVMAQPGGVLTRAGHTEAGCDLARLSGLDPSAVIVEIMNDDGTMARRPDLEKFAEQHTIKVGTIADLIRYRLRTENFVRKTSESLLRTRHGEFRMIGFQSILGNETHGAGARFHREHAEPLARAPIDTCRTLVGVQESVAP
jgi:3,4-dihydroxy 2-butanone 4-phosphate synthase/GTP cyclohydrolase II